jgi:hypothetical protein
VKSFAKREAFTRRQASPATDNESRIHARIKEPVFMSEAFDHSGRTTSLRRRRVIYQTDIASFGEGIVTAHDEEKGVVIVMDVEDGSFWRGSDEDIEVIV